MPDRCHQLAVLFTLRELADSDPSYAEWINREALDAAILEAMGLMMPEVAMLERMWSLDARS